MVLPDNFFQLIRENIKFDFDVFTGNVSTEVKTPFFVFDAFYEEKYIVENEEMIDLSKIKYGFYSEVIPEEIELSEVQKKDIACFFRDFYDNVYYEAKEEWLKEIEAEAKAPLFNHKYTKEKNDLTWYN
ncbi:hypothetical protein [Capnocytophaga canis]|uniref:hypothetical protein n=1 Tax=Capnocytophaga canis TaxID=1848903 RepID=UPI0037D2B374